MFLETPVFGALPLENVIYLELKDKLGQHQSFEYHKGTPKHSGHLFLFHFLFLCLYFYLLYWYLFVSVLSILTHFYYLLLHLGFTEG